MYFKKNMVWELFQIPPSLARRVEMLCFRIIPDSFQSTFQIIPKSFMQLIRNTRVVPCNFPDIPDGKVMINNPHSPSPACLQKFPVGQTLYFARVHFSRSPVNFLVADPIVRFIQAIQNEGSNFRLLSRGKIRHRITNFSNLCHALTLPSERNYCNAFFPPSLDSDDTWLAYSGNRPRLCGRLPVPFSLSNPA